MSVDPADYRLTSEQIRERFERRISPVWFPERREPAQRPPTVVLLGGQPGAGKSRATDDVLDEYRADGMVALTGDALKPVHPAYTELLERAPLQMPAITDQATAPWVAMAKNHARDTGRSFLLEGTFHTPQVTIDTAQEFVGAGFQTHVAALAVPRHVSLLDAADRYFGDHRAGLAARFTDLERHDRGYEGTARLLAEVAASPFIDRVTVFTRSGEALFDRRRIERGRAVELTADERGPWVQRLVQMSQYAKTSGQVTPETKAVLHPLYEYARDTVLPAARATSPAEADALRDQLRDGARSVDLVTGRGAGRAAGAAGAERGATRSPWQATHDLRPPARGIDLGR